SRVAGIQLVDALPADGAEVRQRGIERNAGTQPTASEVEQVGDQPIHAVGALHDARQISLTALRQRLPSEHQIGKSLNRPERVAQFVAEDGDELLTGGRRVAGLRQFGFPTLLALVRLQFEADQLGEQANELQMLLAQLSRQRVERAARAEIATVAAHPRDGSVALDLPE